MNFIQKEVFRIIFESRENYRLACENGQVLTGEISGAYRNSESAWPVVGDWVCGRRLPGESGDWILIEELKERRSVIKRKNAEGRSSQNQILAANVDVLFIVTSANSDFNLNRVERYLSLVAGEAIRPVILLNKIEVAAEPQKYLTELAEWFKNIPVLGVSALSGQLAGIHDYMVSGTTVTFVGSSGVGKSSLLNALTGSRQMQTGNIRETDSKGRHTTTHRELIFSENGTAIIDTPGLRSVGLTEDAQMGEWFSDIEQLFSQCKFADCGHGSEPGCAVQKALSEAIIEMDRWQNYLQMQKEIRFEKRKADIAFQAEEKKKWVKIGKQIKQIKKARER